MGDRVPNKPLTSTNEHEWTPVKDLDVLNHNKTKKQLQHSFFLNIMQTCNRCPILDTLEMPDHFHQ